MLAPRLLSVIVSVVLAATNEYHTSKYVPAGKHPTILPLADASFNVPAVLVHVGLEVKLIDPEQSSFAGGLCVTQILKLPALLLLWV